MNKEHSLEEDIRHGTKERPLAAMRFHTGSGTPYVDKFAVQRHWHHEIEFLKIRKGSYTVELNLENYRLKEGDFCLINSGELHKMDGDVPDTAHDAVIFHPNILAFSYHDEIQDEVIDPLLSQTDSLPHVIPVGAEGYREVTALYDQVMAAGLSGTEGWYFAAKMKLLEFICELYRNRLIVPSYRAQNAAEKDRIDRYKRIVSYIQENYEKRVTLDQLAEAAQCTPQSLCRFFKGIAGVSPIQYLIQYRVEQAGRMLKDSTKSVLEISLDCGFSNVSYFIRQFRKIMGVTPGEYRGVSDTDNSCSF